MILFKVIGFSVLALDGCGLGQGEGELSVKELWLDIREKVTEQLTNLLSDRWAEWWWHPVWSVWHQIRALPPLRHGARPTEPGDYAAQDILITHLQQWYGYCLIMNTCLARLITKFLLLCRYLCQSDTIRGEQGHQGQEDPAPELCWGVTLQWKVQHQTSLELSRQRLLCCQPLLQVCKY